MSPRIRARSSRVWYLVGSYGSVRLALSSKWETNTYCETVPAHRRHSADVDQALRSQYARYHPRNASRNSRCRGRLSWEVPCTQRPIHSMFLAHLNVVDRFDRTLISNTSSRIQANLDPFRSSKSISTSKSSKCSFWVSSSKLDGPGTMETRMEFLTSGVRCKTIWVAKRVQRSDAIGNERPVRPSKSEDLPLDWSPTTTICSVR